MASFAAPTRRLDLKSSVTMASSPSSALTGVIIGLVSSFGSIVLIFLIVFIFWASGCAGSGRIILDRIGRPGEYDDEQAFAREEAEALENMDDMSRTEYLRAKGVLRCQCIITTMQTIY